MAAGRNRNGSRAARQRDADIEGRIADDDGIGSVRTQTAEAFDRRERNRQQSISVVDRVAKRTARKVPPQVEVLELDACALLEVSGQKRQKYIVTQGEAVEKFTHAGHYALSRARLFQLHGQVFEIQRLERVECIGRHAVIGGRLRQNPRVRATVERNAAKRVRDPVKIFKRTSHSSAARAAREHKSAVDVEKEECLQTGTVASAVSLRRARCPRAALSARVLHRS